MWAPASEPFVGKAYQNAWAGKVMKSQKPSLAETLSEIRAKLNDIDEKLNHLIKNLRRFNPHTHDFNSNHDFVN